MNFSCEWNWFSKIEKWNQKRAKSTLNSLPSAKLLKNSSSSKFWTTQNQTQTTANLPAVLLLHQFKFLILPKGQIKYYSSQNTMHNYAKIVTQEVIRWKLTTKHFSKSLCKTVRKNSHNAFNQSIEKSHVKIITWNQKINDTKTQKQQTHDRNSMNKKLKKENQYKIMAYFLWCDDWTRTF